MWRLLFPWSHTLEQLFLRPPTAAQNDMLNMKIHKIKECFFSFLCFYLYLKLEPLQDSSVLCIAFGCSASLKKAWYSTHIFQNDLHTSRLAMQNSSVSLHNGWMDITFTSTHSWLDIKNQSRHGQVLTPTLSCSLMRKCLRLKLSLRIFAQLKVLILVFPFGNAEEEVGLRSVSRKRNKQPFKTSPSSYSQGTTEVISYFIDLYLLPV